MTQLHLAAAVDISTNTLSELESVPPKRHPMLYTVEDLARALKVPITDLLSPDKNDP